jgi:hypothetical protein
MEFYSFPPAHSPFLNLTLSVFVYEIRVNVYKNGLFSAYSGYYSVCRVMLTMTRKKPFKTSCRALSIAVLCFIFFKTGAHAQVTAIYSDYGGFWTSSTTSLNAVKPDNNHNLLGFTWNGTTYSTGVNDATLTSHSVAFTPLSFRAFPIDSVPNTAGGSYFVMLGQLYDGVNNGTNSSPTPFPANPSGAQLATFLTDGVKGLDLGTGLANIPAGSVLRFNLSSNGISLAAINDGKPDIFVTEEATTSASSPDLFKFVDISGNTVGNVLNVVTSSLPQLGNWMCDFYDLTAQQTMLSFIDQVRPLAYYAADLSAFGITPANYMNAVALIYIPNGQSDPAFLAFNEPSISVSTQLSFTAQPTSYTNSIVLSPVPAIQVRDGLGTIINQAGIPVTASIASGTGTLAGTLTVNTNASGVATFSDLSVSGSGNISVQFSSTSLQPVVTGSLSPIILPLNWLSFTGEVVKAGVLLQWSTTDERNTKDFVIQHSVEGSAWQGIGTLPAAGSQSINNYQYTDGSPGKGPNYYRLLQRDLDGNDTYSTTVLVSTPGVMSLVVLYPNPVTTGLLNISLQQAASVTLYNNNGEPVLRKQLTAGLQQLNVQGLPKGMYSLTVDKISYKVEIL